MGSFAQKFIQSLASQRCRGFLHSAAMRSTALPSDHYGDPLAVYAAKQAREARKAAEKAAQPVHRPTLTLKRKSGEWSEARRRAEELFEIPAAASR